jgi:hypothetical protein
MGPIRCPETSVKDYHLTLRYTPEELPYTEQKSEKHNTLNISKIFSSQVRFVFEDFVPMKLKTQFNRANTANIRYSKLFT